MVVFLRSKFGQFCPLFQLNSDSIGYGIIDSNEFVRASGIPGGTHAHNYILNILIMGGTICLIEHIYMYINIVKHILNLYITET